MKLINGKIIFNYYNMNFSFVVNKRKNIKPVSYNEKLFLLDVNDNIFSPTKLSSSPLAKDKKELNKLINKEKIKEDNEEKIKEDDKERNIKMRSKYSLKISPFYLNNRKKFIQKINDIYYNYKKEYANILKNNIITCESISEKKEFELMTHQKLVRDYLSLNTPYRGLLLYFSLGSGKTCSSIAIAEGLKSEKRIYIMTPASLSSNYMNSLKECGDPIYKLKQKWIYKTIKDIKTKEELNEYSEKFSLPIDYIKKNGLWVASIKGSPNFSNLTTDEQKSLNSQIELMIHAKYTFINFNGNRSKNWITLSNNNKISSPFDNSVVIIDEVHIFIGEITSILQKKNHIEHPTYKMYKAIMMAENARIVLLTGTPIVNKPVETAILYNMLRGIIRSWVFKIPNYISIKFNDKIFEKLLKENDITTYDYYKFNSINNTLTITRNPFGFIRSNNKGEYNGVILNEDGEISNDDFNKQVTIMIEDYINENNDKNIKIELGETKYNYLFPDKDDDFNAKYIDPENRVIKNQYQFEINILGLTSYYRSENEKLVPRTILPDQYKKNTINDVDKKNYLNNELFNEYHIELIPMSEYQINIYNELRTFEISKERKKRKNNLLDELDFQKYSSSYRLDSRTACNFVFPKEVPKPLSITKRENIIKSKKGGSYKKKSISSTSKKLDIIKKTNKKFVNKDKDKNEKIKNKEKYEKEDDEKEDEYQDKDDYEKEDNYDDEKEDNDDEDEKDDDKDDEDDEDNDEKERDDDDKDDEDDDEDDEDDDKDNDKDDDKDDDKDENEKNKKYINKKNDYFDEDDEDDEEDKINIEEYNVLNELSNGDYLKESSLSKYSEKFLKILNNIRDPDNIGSHLFYSFFKNLEGVGIFKLVLEKNGFYEFKIIKNKKGQYEIENYDTKKKYFVLYTGDVDSEIREIILSIYNSRWENIKNSPKIIKQLKDRNNYLGEIIKVLMITKAGATGIDLKNTRFVHICEPFWNITLIQQAVGRAKRICSHVDLEDKYKTVKIFMYLSVFTKSQIKTKAYKTIMDFDRIDNIPSTTDEHLLWISYKKNEINSQFIESIKKTSIDCDIYSSKENIKCLSFGIVNSNDFTNSSITDIDNIDKINDSNDIDNIFARQNDIIKQKIELSILTNVPYYLNSDGKLIKQSNNFVIDNNNNKVYDYDDYTDIDENGEPKHKLRLIGEIILYDGDEYPKYKKKRIIKLNVNV